MNLRKASPRNPVTSILVVSGSRRELPVSKTILPLVPLFAIDRIKRTIQACMILTILVAWVTTLPLGALLAGLVYFIAGQLA